MLSYPHQGQLYSAASKKFNETIVFVHFFGGSKRHIKRHIDFVNELGFDAVAFNLSFNKNFWLKKWPLSRAKNFGLRHIWGDEVEDVLNAVIGPKIVFAFSNPAACAIDAIARRKARDIKGLICDSGPFVQMAKCSWNLLTHEYVVKNPFLRVPATAGLATLWGLDHSQRLKEDLAQLPNDFAILSVRGWNDPLVPPSAIDGAFADAKQVRLETLALPTGGHLNGLKDFADTYQPRVARFLSKLSSATK